MRLSSRIRLSLAIAVLAISAPLFAVTAQEEAETLTVYSGRNESLIAPILAQFTADTGVQVEVRYGNTFEIAATILEEGANSPADVYIAQDAGALGSLAAAGQLRVLAPDILSRVPAELSSVDGQWVGLSARARVLVYNPELVSEDQLPASLLDVVNEEWAGKFGWAPTNASFQAHVTALRILLGEEAARAFVDGLVANGVTYSGNGAILQAVIAGEVQFGLVNHYYLGGVLAETPDAPAVNYFFPNDDVGSLLNVAGVGVVSTSDTPALAERLVLYLLGNQAQTYFAEQTYEYPVVAGIAAPDYLPALSEIGHPEINLSQLADLQATVDLLTAAGAL